MKALLFILAIGCAAKPGSKPPPKEDCFTRLAGGVGVYANRSKECKAQRKAKGAE